MSTLGPGQVFVFSPSTGDTLRTLTGANNGDEFGYAVGANHDVDLGWQTPGDDVPDIIVGAPGFNAEAGTGYIYDGPTGALLFTLAQGVGDAAPRTGDRFGHAVLGSNGHVVVGAPGRNFFSEQSDMGAVFVIYPWDQGSDLDELENGFDDTRLGTTLFDLTIGADSGFGTTALRAGSHAPQILFFRVASGHSESRIDFNSSGAIAMADAGGYSVLAYEDGHLFVAPAAALTSEFQGPASSQGTYILGISSPDSFLVFRGIVTPLIDLPNMPRLYIKGVNERGEMVGTTTADNGTIDNAFLYSNGAVTPLTDAFTDANRPTGAVSLIIGDGGHIIVNAGSIAFLIENGVAHELWFGTASAVNSSGLVVGLTASGDDVRIRLPDGSTTTVAGYDLPSGTPINDLGQVFLLAPGTRYLWRWSGGQLSQLSTVTAGDDYLYVAAGDTGETYVLRATTFGTQGPRAYPTTTTTWNSFFLDAAGVDQGLVLNGTPVTGIGFGAARVRDDGSLITYGDAYFRADRVAPAITPGGSLASAVTRLDGVAITGALADAGIGVFTFAVVVPGADQATIYTGLSKVGSTVTFNEPFSGRAHVAARIGGSIVWYAPTSGGGFDSGRELPIAGGRPIVGDIAVFTSGDLRVHIVAANADGHLILIYQLNAGADPGSLENWASADLTADHFVPQGIAMPAITSGFTAFSTSWGGMNVAWLDDAGAVRTAWWAPGITLWREDNLSQRAGAPRLVGNLAPYLTSWNGINIAGTDESGGVVALWWVPQFGDDWETARFDDAPAVVAGSLTAYVTPWGGLNIAGVTSDGQVSTLWWTPALSGWNIETLEVSGTDPVLAPTLTSAVDFVTGSMTIGGVTEDGSRLTRLLWTPTIPFWTAETI